MALVHPQSPFLASEVKEIHIYKNLFSSNYLSNIHPKKSAQNARNVTAHRFKSLFPVKMSEFVKKKAQYLQELLDVCVRVGHRGRGSIRQASLVVVQCAV